MGKMNIIESIKTSTIKADDRIDVRAGRATYGQMVALGRIIDAEQKRIEEEGGEHDVSFTKDIIRVLHPDVNPAMTVDNARYAYSIIEAVRFWKEQEAKRLKYEPTAEEKQAGFEKLAETTGPRGVAVSIGKDFAEHPDGVFDWTYASVFTILEIDLARFKYNRRLQEIRDNKRKREERNRSHSRR